MAAKPRKKKQKDGEEGEGRKRKRTQKGTDKSLSRKKVKPGEPGYDPYDFTSSEEEEEEEEGLCVGTFRCVKCPIILLTILQI